MLDSSTPEWRHKFTCVCHRGASWKWWTSDFICIARELWWFIKWYGLGLVENHPIQRKQELTDRVEKQYPLYKIDSSSIVVRQMSNKALTLTLDEDDISLLNTKDTTFQTRVSALEEIIDQLIKTANKRNELINRLVIENEKLRMVDTTSPEEQDNRFIAMADEL